MLTGGPRSSGSTPSQRSDAARLDSIRFHSPSTIKAGFGSCASSSRSSDSRSGCLPPPSWGSSRYGGAKPPASNSRLRSPIGRSRCWARWTRSWRLGLDRPVSTKLRCFVETFASRDSSSWLRPRRVRQKRISSPAVWGSCSVCTTTHLKLAGVRSGSRRHYTRGNRRAALPPGSLPAKQPDDQRRQPMTDAQAFDEISSRSAAELAEKYVALWNEPDTDRRGRLIAELWTEEGRHILQPPQEIRAIAARPGIAMTASLEARGYEEIAARAASAYEHWVGSEGLSFRGRDDAERVADVVK